MRLEVQCPLCGHMMEPMPATEWSLFGQGAVEMLCPNCTYTEDVYFSTRKVGQKVSPEGGTMEFPTTERSAG